MEVVGHSSVAELQAGWREQGRDAVAAPTRIIWLPAEGAELRRRGLLALAGAIMTGVSAMIPWANFYLVEKQAMNVEGVTTGLISAPAFERWTDDPGGRSRRDLRPCGCRPSWAWARTSGTKPL